VPRFPQTRPRRHCPRTGEEVGAVVRGGGEGEDEELFWRVVKGCGKVKEGWYGGEGDFAEVPSVDFSNTEKGSCGFSDFVDAPLLVCDSICGNVDGEVS